MMLSAFIGVAGALIAGFAGLALPIVTYRQKADIITLLIAVGVSASLLHSAYDMARWGLN
jgi:hypothetical protein